MNLCRMSYKNKGTELIFGTLKFYDALFFINVMKSDLGTGFE